MEKIYVLEYNEVSNHFYEYVADENGYRTYDPSKALQFYDIIAASEKLLELGYTDVHVQGMLREVVIIREEKEDEVA